MTEHISGERWLARKGFADSRNYSSTDLGPLLEAYHAEMGVTATPQAPAPQNESLSSQPSVQLQDLLIQDLAMLVRRLIRKHPNERMVAQVKDFLVRKGLQGSVLRTAQDNIGNGELPEPSTETAKECEFCYDILPSHKSNCRLAAPGASPGLERIAREIWSAFAESDMLPKDRNALMHMVWIQKIVAILSRSLEGSGGELDALRPYLQHINGCEYPTKFIAPGEVEPRTCRCILRVE